MKAVRLRSLQAKLALRLGPLYMAATAIAVAALIYQAYETADTLNDRELSLQAADLARYVAADSTGAARLALPPEFAARHQAAGSTDIFAIRRGRMLSFCALPGWTPSRWTSRRPLISMTSPPKSWLRWRPGRSHGKDSWRCMPIPNPWWSRATAMRSVMPSETL